MLDTNRNPLKSGDKVKLLKPSKGYRIGLSNPAVGTEWECVGKVGVRNTVYWENGYQNSYKDFELVNVEENCVSIWEN
jgi:hypothetical protein